MHFFFIICMLMQTPSREQTENKKEILIVLFERNDLVSRVINLAASVQRADVVMVYDDPL